MTPIIPAATLRHDRVSRLDEADASDAERRIATIRPLAYRTYVVTPLTEPLRADVLAHFLALDASDRALRFGHAVRNHTIEAYVAGMRFERGEVFGAHDTRLNLIGVGHLVFTGKPDRPDEVEFGGSVQREARARGVGSALFRYGRGAARALAARTLSMHYDAGNHAMHRIANRAGMTRHCTYGEVHATLDLTA